MQPGKQPVKVKARSLLCYWAVRELGTDDIEQVVRRYNGKAFGFASRNFYVAFLAALDVEQNVNKYFGKLNRAKPSNDLALELPQYVPAAALEKTFNISRETLRERNPALLEPVWNDSKYIPKGFVLRLNTLTHSDLLRAHS